MTAQSQNQTRRPSRRLVAAMALAIGVAGGIPALAFAESTSSQTTLADHSGTWGGSQGYWPGSGSGGSGGTASEGTAATAVSQAATAGESIGVVLIDTVLPYQNAEAAGTGMVLTSSGQVLTNYHVVQGAGTIHVTIASTGQTYAATVVGSDATDDVALLQLTGASGLSTVTIDKDATTVGQAVTAVGNAEGTGSLTAAAGSISSLTASVTAASEGSGATETLATMIETSADVVAGDSGGPLLDAQGEVVGIDTAASSGSVIDGYAIPITRALSVVDQIRSGAETSTVQIGPAPFLGVELSSTPAGYGSGSRFPTTTAQSGALVAGTVDGAASAAGIVAGDTITSVDGTAVTSATDLATALATTNPGQQISITWVDASSAQHTATVTLGASPVA